MNEPPSLSPRAMVFRQAISNFIAERRDTKLKGQSGEKVSQIAAKYEYETWLADAARRVSQIQAVTHVLKATHPDAKGSSFYIEPTDLPPRAEIGSHLLSEFESDVVGNAAALDVYKFLRIEVENRQLLAWFKQDDADLLTALSIDKETAQGWANAFKSLIRQSDSPASHSGAKQLYWCVAENPSEDSSYHLVQPMFPSSLLHRIHEEISAARFGEDNKSARQSFYKKEASEFEYRNYGGLAVRKLGGTKPQNISQLNSERGGGNYLLASLPPPGWKSNQSKQFFSSDSLFKQFRYFERVNWRVQQLIELLKSNPSPTMETRKTREKIERALGNSLAAFGLFVRHSFEPGWTRVPECELELCEQIWLDPERAELQPREDYKADDIKFAETKEWNDWPDQVADRFSNWLNDILRKADIPVGDAEHRHWARQAIVDAEFPATFQRKSFSAAKRRSLND